MIKLGSQRPVKIKCILYINIYIYTKKYIYVLVRFGLVFFFFLNQTETKNRNLANPWIETDQWGWNRPIWISFFGLFGLSFFFFFFPPSALTLPLQKNRIDLSIDFFSMVLYLFFSKKWLWRLQGYWGNCEA